jgi:hypothetical protein
MTLNEIREIIDRLGGLTEIGSRALTDLELDRIELLSGGKIDPTFRLFTREASGKAWLQSVVYPLPTSRELAPVSYFYGGGDDDSDPNSLITAVHSYQKRIPAGWLPIAEEGFGNQICLYSSKGLVGLWNHEDEDISQDGPCPEVLVVAQSFPQWLHQLRRDE